MKRRFKSVLFYKACIGLLALLVLSLVSCGGTTKPKFYAVSGKVVTENNEPLSDVTVLLYRHEATNLSLTTLKAEHPNHGVDISMLDDFDHRTSSPVYSVKTNVDGAFVFPKYKREDTDLFSTRKVLVLNTKMACGLMRVFLIFKQCFFQY